MKKNFICIPLEIIFEETLNVGEKLFFGFLITTSKDSFCIGTNKYFSENLNLSISTISKYIEKLERLKFIETLYSDEQGILIRYIYIKKI